MEVVQEVIRSAMASVEADLVSRCREGDDDAWADLYRTHAPTVARFLRRLLGRGDDLDDLVQEVFVGAFKSMSRFRGDAKLTTWLYGIASHVVGRRLRDDQRWRRRQRLLRDEADPTGRVGDVADAAHARALLSVVADVLDGMDLAHRTVWVMREVEGMDTDEVAIALEVPAGTVRSRLFHARKMILDGLARGGRPGPKEGT